jgi:hypothetical protein
MLQNRQVVRNHSSDRRRLHHHRPKFQKLLMLRLLEQSMCSNKFLDNLALDMSSK